MIAGCVLYTLLQIVLRLDGGVIRDSARILPDLTKKFARL
jgi:hypothetical protein